MKNFGKKMGSPMVGFTLTEKTSISSVPIFPSPGALVAGDRVCQGRRNFFCYAGGVFGWDHQESEVLDNLGHIPCITLW
jgi:hypothetical protein